MLGNLHETVFLICRKCFYKTYQNKQKQNKVVYYTLHLTMLWLECEVNKQQQYTGTLS